MKNVCPGRRMFYYNTVCEIILHEYVGNEKDILDGCEDILRGVQKRLNIYDPDSELSRLNQNYVVNEPYPTSRELYALLRDMMLFSEISGGSYDASVGPLVRLWNFTAKQPRIPDKNEVMRTMERCGYKKLLLHDGDETVTFSAPGMVIDAGGVGKGYAAELTAGYLRKSGVTSASINFGGNLYLLGGYRESDDVVRPWRVGVQKPWDKKGASLGTLYLQDLGAATSAGYERYFEQSGEICHHILNPTTGYPAETDLLSVTIISDSPQLTDFMSTAFFVLGVQEGEKVIRKIQQDFFLEYIAVTQNGVLVSEGIRDHFQMKAIQKQNKI